MPRDEETLLLTIRALLEREKEQSAKWTPDPESRTVGGLVRYFTPAYPQSFDEFGLPIVGGLIK